MNHASNSVEQSKIHTALSAGLYVVVCGYAVLAIVSSFAAPVDKFDDAIPLLHGMLVQQGYTPNLDFYSFYPPLNLYLNAAAFRLLGRTVIAERVVADIFYVIILLLVTWFFRSRFRSWGPVVPAAVLVVATSIGAAITLPVWSGFAISLAALLTYLCSQNVERHRVWLVALSGVLAALAILCRINFGCYAAAVIALDFVRRLWLDRDERNSRHLRTELTMMGAFAVPLVVCCIGFCLWIYGRSIDTAVSQFIVTAQRLMAARGFIRLPFQAHLACVVVLPASWFSFRLLNGSSSLTIKAFLPATLGVGVLLLALTFGANFTIAVIAVALEVALVVFMHIFIRRLEVCELSILLFFCCLLHYYLSRADWFHWRLLPVAGALLMPFLFMSSYDAHKRQFESSTSMGTILLVMAMAVFVFVAAPEFRPGFTAFPKGLTLIANFVHDLHSTDSDRMLGSTAPPPVWSSVYPDDGELAALRYLRQRSDNSTPLFVGLRDHSRAFWNDLRMYWLAERPIAVRTFQLEAKVATETAVQREIIADLERNKKIWVILDSDRDGDEEFSKTRYQGSKLLDRYIEQNFREQATFGHFVVLTRASD